ncbi:MAG: S8 family serine peptidase [Clostridia bacterium]|nr:S8 family serine peptidase [Clostridia bacterium]
MLQIRYILLSLATILLLSVTASADEYGRPDFDPGSVLVITKPSSGLFKLQSDKNANDVIKELGITDIDHVLEFPTPESKSAFSLRSTVSDGKKELLKLTLPVQGKEYVLEAVDKLNNSGTVSVAQPNYYYYLDDGFEEESVPDDQYYEAEQSSLKAVGAEEVWDYHIDCSNVKIAILDSGLMREHEDLKDNIWENPNEIPNNGIDDDDNGYIDDIHGWDFTTETSKNTDPTDPVDPYNSPPLQSIQGHGTHVAGIASAVTNNNLGVASLAGNAKLVGVRVFDDYGSSTSVCILSGLLYAGLMGCDIANCSWGIYNNTYDTVMTEAIKSCPNTLFVCAAGNNEFNVDNPSLQIRPAGFGYDNTISIASSAANDTLSSFSNYGTVNIDLAAPGENAPGVSIYSTGNVSYSPSSYIRFKGTSQAAPLVSSAAAVLKARNPSLTPKDLKTYLIAGCDTPSTLSYTDSSGNVRRVTGNRRLNAAYSIYLTDVLVNNTVTITNHDNLPINAGDTPTEINAKITFNNYPNTDNEDYIKEKFADTQFIVSVYTEDNALAGIMYLTPDLDNLSAPLEASLTLDGNTEVGQITLLTWNGLDNMKPLGDAKALIE